MKRYEIAWYEYRESMKIGAPMRKVLFYKGFGYRDQFDRKLKTLRKKGFEIVGMIVDFHQIPKEEFANY